jgi:hypothetical protein
MAICMGSTILIPPPQFATGNLMWRDRSVGKGSVTHADGRRTSGREQLVGLAGETPAGAAKGTLEILTRDK